jgi:hypothetical protein
MKVLDDFLKFLIENKDDPRVKITKKIKYGFKHYTVTFHIDDEPKLDSSNSIRYRMSDSVEFCVDNRNNCIEILGHSDFDNIIIEDLEMVRKWSEILEAEVSSGIENKTKLLIESALSKCYNKNLLRDYKVKKLLTKNERLQPRRSRKNK